MEYTVDEDDIEIEICDKVTGTYFRNGYMNNNNKVYWYVEEKIIFLRDDYYCKCNFVVVK